MRKIGIALILGSLFILAGCIETTPSAQQKEAQAVERQQGQYAKGQPVPAFDWSLERDLAIQLYHLRNAEVSTHTVWRSITGAIEGDCPSMGYGLPYDTSLTNPSMPAWKRTGNGVGGVTVGQAEPNGIFASTNTSATWVFCIGATGKLEPHYIETKVTAYPYPVKVDYATNRVLKSGEAAATIDRRQ